MIFKIDYNSRFIVLARVKKTERHNISENKQKQNNNKAKSKQIKPTKQNKSKKENEKTNKQKKAKGIYKQLNPHNKLKLDFHSKSLTNPRNINIYFLNLYFKTPEKENFDVSFLFLIF